MISKVPLALYQELTDGSASGPGYLHGMQKGTGRAYKPRERIVRRKAQQAVLYKRYQTFQRMVPAN